MLAVASLTEPVAHKSINRPDKRQNAQSVEPPGPPERRNDADRERGSSFIPEAIAVCGFDAEGVAARRQVAVGSKAPCPDVVPVAVKTLEDIGILIFFGRSVIQGGKFEGNYPVLPVELEKLGLGN